MDLYINELFGDHDNLHRHIKGIKNKIKSEYSILRRIVGGDEVSYRCMILLVPSTNKNAMEVYEEYFSVKFKLVICSQDIFITP